MIDTINRDKDEACGGKESYTVLPSSKNRQCVGGSVPLFSMHCSIDEMPEVPCVYNDD